MPKKCKLPLQMEVEALCREVLRGDRIAKRKLRAKFRNKVALKIAESFASKNNGINLVRELESFKASNVRCHEFNDGNLFKLVQGGLPSLGRKAK
jgi:hypothetical protein